MLVLSRRLQEKILFPNINTSVQIVAVKPGLVRLGIEAPPEVVVLREEVAADSNRAQATLPRAGHALSARVHDLGHKIRNRLNAASVGLALLRRQVQAGMVQASEATLRKIDEEFQAMRRQVETAVRNATDTPAAVRRTRRALLVEDDHNERELLAGFLRLAGLDVATAGDGCDALDYLRRQSQPDVVLLDMMMPRCDGPTTVREIRRNPAFAGLRIFGMSGHAPERFDLPRGAGGIDRWFGKPLNPEALLRELQAELARAPAAGT